MYDWTGNHFSKITFFKTFFWLLRKQDLNCWTRAFLPTVYYSDTKLFYHFPWLRLWGFSGWRHFVLKWSSVQRVGLQCAPIHEFPCSILSYFLKSHHFRSWLIFFCSFSWCYFIASHIFPLFHHISTKKRHLQSWCRRWVFPYLFLFT